MSTRGMIFVNGSDTYSKKSSASLYTHSDSYPTGNLQVILDALKKAQSIVKADHERWAKIDGDKRPIYTSTMAGCLVGEATTVYGMGARVESVSSHQALNLDELQGGEWNYVVDLITNEVRVLDDSLDDVDPYSYVEQLREECKQSERDETARLISEIEALGFKIVTAKAAPKAKRGTTQGTLDECDHNECDSVCTMKPKAKRAPKAKAKAAKLSVVSK